MKRCSRCKKDLPLNNYYVNKAHKDGLNNECKACARVSQRMHATYGPQCAKSPLVILKKQCKEFAMNKDPMIEDVLSLAKSLNSFIDTYELE